ncbi:SigB/SigF/SigG family RNA polymerase sigma factor [Amycolatopsis aidingensis]|uniref:SigB/SigF/SigG family RNA polymerase sigma factor n=1 Tax=Amycolatopsis aidingensis TaxID=2842453 RepID=UPI0022B6E77B|nr:SigB/SigF/SigG family RNA polymerase sigma factor [Amycolatopsis aidingensis]
MTAGRKEDRSSADYSDVLPLLVRMSGLDGDDPERARLRSAVVTRCLPLAEHIAHRFSGRGEPREDLVQVARLGLVHAVDRFEPDRGKEFISFAVPTIMGEIRRYFRDTAWSVRVPRRLKELHLALNQASAELAQRCGRAPTPSELAAELGVELEEVVDGLLAGNAYQSVSVDGNVDEVGVASLVDTLGGYDAQLEEVENHEALQPLLQELPARERSVLMLRFFGNLTQTQIARQMGISQMHVSRLLAKTLRQLREELTQS